MSNCKWTFLFQVKEDGYKYTITSYALQNGGLPYRIIICPKLYERNIEEHLRYNKNYLPKALTKIYKKRKVYKKLKTFITLTNIPLENI